MFNVKDATPILALGDLEDLDVNVLKLNELAPFTKLGKLKRLQATQLFVTDLSPLSQMTALEDLSPFLPREILRENMRIPLLEDS